MELQEREEQLNLENLRSRLKIQSEILTNISNSSTQSTSELNLLLQDSNFRNEIKKLGFLNFQSLGPDDLDAYMRDAKEQLRLIEAENADICNEVKVHSSTYKEDSTQLEREIEGLDCSLKFLETQCLDKRDPGASFENGHMVNQHEDYNFKLLELTHQIEKKKDTLTSLEELDDTLKRVEAVSQIEDTFTGLKVIDFDGNGIRFSLETFIPNFGSSQNELINDPLSVIHELFVEVKDGTLELMKVEIFPNDVFIDEIFDDTKLSWKFFPSLLLQSVMSSLEWLVEKVQERIYLCTMRRLIVKDASNSRHSFEYSDRNGTVVVHMASGIDAFIKLPYSWPLVKSTLKLVSLKNRNNNTKGPSLSSFKIEEFGSTLDVETQQNLSSFVDAIEKMLGQ
ncbi:hypothetical protein ACHQM5_028441 [Ranunculus cassubicifolius]